jgi:hypothetical protein
MRHPASPLIIRVEAGLLLGPSATSAESPSRSTSVGSGAIMLALAEISVPV